MAQRPILHYIQALGRPNLDSTESLEAEQHFCAYMRVVAYCLNDLRGGIVHGNGGGCSQRDCTIDNIATGMM